jgi:hypothetical protein
MRGRNNRKGPNPLTRSYESNGPDVKIRGTAQHVAEKYSQLARDAQASGDPVSAENYLQHAEHYFRLIAAAQGQFQQTYGGPPRPFEEGGSEEPHEGDGEDGGGYQPQPQMAEGMPQPDMRQPQPGDDGNYPPRQPQQQGDRQNFDRNDRQNFNRNNFRDQRQDGQRNDGPRRDRFRDDNRRDDNRRDDNRRDDNRRDDNRRDDGRRFQNQPGPSGDETGLPSFLTTPVRPAQPVEGNAPNGNGAGPNTDGAPEGDGEGGHYSMRSRRRRGRGGRGFGGGESADSDAPTSAE